MTFTFIRFKNHFGQMCLIPPTHPKQQQREYFVEERGSILQQSSRDLEKLRHIKAVLVACGGPTTY